MHKKVNPNRVRNAIIMIAIGAIAVIAAGFLIINTTTGAASAGHIQEVAQPISAGQIAQSLHCGRFKDQGPATLLSDDSGSCYIGSQKYAINTFPDKEARDSWLKSAVQLGVVPKWETPTSVVYPSVT